MSDAYGMVLSELLYPAWERVVKRRPTLELLRHLERTQWCSADELHAIQAGALRRLLRHAHRHVPLYRDRFDALDLRPEDIRGPEDLDALPILTRDDARDRVDERRSLAPPFASVHKSTSGTMGKPLVFEYDRGSEIWRNAVRLRSYAWSGYPVGARSLHYWAAPPSPPPLKQRLKVGADRALKRELYVDCTPRGDEALAAAVVQIRRHRPDVIVAYSQAGAALARYVNRTGSRTWDTIPVICGAERLFDVDRRAIEEAFGDAVFETYGAREFMLMACECPAHDGLHEAMENVIVEIVVPAPDGHRRARPGEIGDVVVTDLHNFAMPFIRYANGDRAVARAPGRCSCGRSLSRIGPIEGRVTETLHDAEGNEVSGLVFNLVFVEIAGASRQFQVIQHLDRSLTLKLVPTDDLGDEHVRAVRRQCDRYLPGVPLNVELVSDIAPTPAGKRRVVVVERARGGAAR